YHRVSSHVYGSSEHVKRSVNGKDESNTSRADTNRFQYDNQHQDTRPWNGGCSYGGKCSRNNYTQLLPSSEIVPHHLRNENRRDPLIQTGAIHIDCSPYG